MLERLVKEADGKVPKVVGKLLPLRISSVFKTVKPVRKPQLSLDKSQLLMYKVLVANLVWLKADGSTIKPV